MVLTCKTLIPAALIIALGLTVGIEGIFGVSILALLTIFGNSNGALWLAFAGEYGDERDTGAYVASAFDDGPFLALIFLGAAGLGDIRCSPWSPRSCHSSSASSWAPSTASGPRAGARADHHHPVVVRRGRRDQPGNGGARGGLDGLFLEALRSSDSAA